MILQKGKLNVGPLDASHGSSGKSKIADYIAVNEHLDFAISHNSQNACLTEGHLVYTDQGLVPIEEVVLCGVGSLALVGDEFHRITERHDVGIRPTKNVGLDNGMVFTGTPNHQFKVWDGSTRTMDWVRLDELDASRHQFVFKKELPDLVKEPLGVHYLPVAGIPNCNYMSSIPRVLDDSLAFIIGLMVGDGNYNGSTKCSLACSLEQLENQNIFVNFVSSLGLRSTTYQIMDKKANATEVYSAELLRLWRALGLDALKGEHKRVPSTIFRSPKRVIAAFIAGIVESDGCVKPGKDGRITVVSNISKQLVDDVQALCTYLGFRTKLRGEDQTRRNEDTGVFRKTIYEVTVAGYYSIRRFKESVPLTTKAAKLDELIESKGHDPKYKYESRVIVGEEVKNDLYLIRSGDQNSDLFRGYLFVGIDSINDAGDRRVFDITVETQHAYICNGTASHNSHITVFDDGTQYKFNFLPSSVAKGGVKVVVGADAVINPEKALEEIRDWSLTEKNLFLHPLIAIIEPKDVEWEMEHLAYMGSTMTGGGKAKADKVTRTKGLFVRDHPELKKYVANTHELVNSWLAQGETGLLETAQGYDLSQDTIWTGRDGQVKTMYPFNTSRNINPSSFLGFSFVSPRFAGTTILNIRSYGIRVGDSSTASGDFVVKMQDGSEAGLLFSEFGVSAVPPLDLVKSKYPGAIGIVKLGSSGPVYDDQEELSWEEITRRSGSPTPIAEKTSLTLRTRRVFDRSLLQIRNSTMACAPNAISVNFANYLDHKISGVRGKISRAELLAEWPKVAEFVSWVEVNQYWAGTSHAGRVVLLGTGPKRSEMIELV